MDFCYTNYYYYYFCYVKASQIHWHKETNKEKKNENNMLPSIWTKCMELILPLDEKSNKEEKQRKKKKIHVSGTQP